MRYRSNLEAPDLAPYFKLREPPMLFHGHDVPSDPGFLPDCGYWTHDEAAILYHIGKQIGGIWVDLGARLGWTAAHLVASGRIVVAVEPEYRHQPKFKERAKSNLGEVESLVAFCGLESREFFEWSRSEYDGFVVDANHDEPEPLNDTIGSFNHLKPDGAIVFHDFIGKPVRDGVNWLMDRGFKCRVYWTPNLVALCWRGLPNFRAPVHIGDPSIDWHPHLAVMRQDFDFARCS